MADSVARLYDAVIAVRGTDPTKSRTARLLQSGRAKMAKKLAEEAVEVVIDAYQAHMLDEHERMAAKERAFFEQRLATQPKPQPTSGSNTRIPF